MNESILKSALRLRFDPMPSGRVMLVSDRIKALIGTGEDRDDALAKLPDALCALLDAAQETPAARWREKGEPDPHGDSYACERAKLCMGNRTDDEIANAVFLYDHRNGLESMSLLTAAKERIRWLSRALVSLRESVEPEILDIAAAACERSGSNEMRDVARELRGQVAAQRASLYGGGRP